MFFDDMENQFVNRLIELREQKGVSAREMSISLGQNNNYINAIENKRSLPTITSFFYICEYFQISPAEFFGYKHEIEPIAIKVLSALEKFDEEEVNIIFSLIDKFEKYNR